MPKLARAQLHVGGSVHYRGLKNPEPIRYRARPFGRTADLRLVDTGNLAGTGGELGLRAELAFIRGSFHATAESYRQETLRPGLQSPTFNGGYAELGYFVRGEATAYKMGVYERVASKAPLGKGGIGAVQINARYDWLDLHDGPVGSGRQDARELSLVWTPVTICVS